MALRAPRFYRSRKVDRPAVEEEFFGEGGLARVRVTYDGEGAATVYFFAQFCWRDGHFAFFALGFVLLVSGRVIYGFSQFSSSVLRGGRFMLGCLHGRFQKKQNPPYT